MSPMRSLSQIEQAFTIANVDSALVVVSVFRLHSGPPPAILRSALDRLQHRHPLLRASISKRGLSYSFAPLDRERRILLDVEDWEEDSIWKQRAELFLNRPFDHSSGPLLRCIYQPAKSSDALSNLILVFHHAIIDGVSGVQLVRQLLSLCADSETAGDQAAVVEARSVPPSLDDLIPDSYRGVRGVPRILRSVWRQLRDDRRYRLESGSAAQTLIHADSACRILVRHLSVSATDALLAQVRKERTHINSVIASAMLLSVRQHVHGEALPIMQAIMFADLRRHLEPPMPADQLGCYLSMLRHTLRTKSSDTLWTLARRLGAGIYRSGKDGMHYVNAVLSKRTMQMMRLTEDRRMGNIALSFAGILDLPERIGDTEVREVHAFITANRFAPELSAYGHLFRGRLSLDFMYLDADMNDAMAERIVDGVMRSLTE